MLLIVMYFLPAVVLSLTPHKKVWYFFDFFLIAWLYRELVKDIMQPAILSTFLVAVLPALLLKAYAIFLKSQDKEKLAKYLPLLSLAGPALCIFFPVEVSDLLK